VSAALATSLSIGLSAFALMAVIAMLCAGLIKLIVGLLARSASAAPAVASPRPMPVVATPATLPVAGIPDDLAIIVAAACHAAIGAHRIVYVAESNRPANWTTEMRARHHQSHLPHR
jgi:hypothetical protein